jgi:VanZ family protein
MNKFKLILSLWLPVLFWVWLIFFLSSLPNLKASQNPFLDEILRKTAHFLEYLILYLLFFRAINWRKTKNPSASRYGNFGLPFLLTFLYSLSDEWHQSFVPTRSGLWRDVMIDNLGNFFGSLIIWRLSPKIPKKLKSWAKKWGVI